MNYLAQSKGDELIMAAIGRLIVMLAAEVVGYATLIRADEKGTLEQLQAHRDKFIYPKIAEHSGRLVRATGDCLLVEFESPTEAVRCAVELQRGMVDRNIRTLPNRRITFRIGVSVGEVTANDDDLVSRAVAALSRDSLAPLIKPGSEFYGEPGNMAVRLAELARPAGICITDAVQDAIRDRLPYVFEDIGKHNVEIGAAPVHCYAVNADFVAFKPRLAAAHSPQSRAKRLRTAAVAVSVFATVGIWGAALLAWLGANSSTAVIPATVSAGPPVLYAGVTADGAALESPSRQSAPMTRTAADRDTQAPPASQTPLASSAVVDGGIQALSSRPASSDIDGVVVRGKQAQSALQTTRDNGRAAVSGIQAPAVVQTTLNSGVAVVWGNQAPSTLQIAPDAATDVVRGTRVFSGPPLSFRPDER
jgi:class 3 adenylate cyclase